ncbi:MAG: SsrA-binding protein SmpB [Bacteroidota bacterium]
MANKQSKDKLDGYLLVDNRRHARHHYDIVDRYIAGLELKGPEVKSIRADRPSLKETYCFFKNNELLLSGLYLKPYAPAAHYNAEPKRLRKLLLTRRELRKLQKQKKEKSLTIIVLYLIQKRGWIKVGIALARGKKQFDKRHAIKERDIKRRTQREGHHLS